MPSITRKPSSADERRRAVEGQVYEAVERLLDEGESYTELSVQRIIDRAGVARSTFYAHFRDKSDLLRRFADRLQREVFDEGNAWTEMDNSLPGLVTTFEKGLALFRAHWPLLTAIDQTAAYDPSVRAFFAVGMDR